MKNHWVDRTLMLFPFEYTLCLNKTQFNASLRSFGIKDVHEWSFLETEYCDAIVHFLENKYKSHAAIVCIKDAKNKTLIQIHGLIVHEAVHIFQKFCELIGEEYPSAEFEAYGIQSIAQGLMVEYERQTKPCAT